MSTIFGAITSEVPKFKVLRVLASGPPLCEVRQYGRQLRAEVEVEHEGEMGQNMGGPFRMLAGFIFGGNTKRAVPGGEAAAGSEKVEMTAPVIMSKKAAESSEKVAMTAPVMVSKAGGGGGSGKHMVKMCFIMPSKYASVEELPVPKDARVHLAEHPEYTVAVIKFSGSFGDANFRKHEALLREAAAKAQLPISDDPEQVQVAGYNPPWCLPWLKTNEVHIPVVGEVPADAGEGAAAQ